ncbi:MAG TPA: hypothetical protein VGR45_19110 [Stellaceae bacterium]|nr:hypothetical protein [Stellaceae bacterium]
MTTRHQGDAADMEIPEMQQKYVIDATMGWPPCFCPVELDKNGEIANIITGINYIGEPPGRVIAVVHAAGQPAVEEWCEKHKKYLDDLFGGKP